ncbi:HD domain-containing protein [Qingshengfaniella alkalisoli]|uniref:5'-deoxynucleotidase n=1 Tax=Qingshengfaniella alkalisoli TaxID=2599296 RepID=A0A5B8IXC2_9RHOB|nr:HD domain-containing protein [Qingshengfaniella alkalisoli]QDY69228.1 HD domain-containing protein [Qingshengfaniella alkalisoli]
MTDRAPEDLVRQLAFLNEADRLKSVERATTLNDGSRQENSGEHSWHVALYAMVLDGQAEPDVRLDRVIKMLLLHDLVEIDAGDNPIHAPTSDPAQQALAEKTAADRIFGLLPEAQAIEFRALWNEFEAAESPDARFAKAMDRVQPLQTNLALDGKLWEMHGVTEEQIRRRVGNPISKGARTLWDHLSAKLATHFAVKS